MSLPKPNPTPSYAVAFVALALSFALCSSSPAIVQVTEHNPLLATERRFQIFMRKYDRSYSTREEYSRCLGIFVANLARAAEHQALDPTTVHGVTPFSDLSPEEFERLYTGGAGLGSLNGVAPAAAETTEEKVNALPESFDWREKGGVTEVKKHISLYFADANRGTLVLLWCSGYHVSLTH